VIYLLQTNGNTINRIQHDNNEPIGFDDIWAFPVFEDEDTEIGVIAAKGGDLIIVPVEPHGEDEEEEDSVLINTPATSHAQFGNEQPILEPIAFLVTSIEDLQRDFREGLTKPVQDGFIDPRWALKKVKPKKHAKDCRMAESHAGLTYILTGEDAGSYQVVGFTASEIAAED